MDNPSVPPEQVPAAAPFDVDIDVDVDVAAPPAVSGPLRPASEVLLEELVPSSPLVRRRAFGSVLRVLLSGRGE